MMEVFMSNPNVKKSDHRQSDRAKNTEQTIELTDLETKKDPKGGIGGIEIPGVSGSKSSCH